jgi:hypothetical protein
MLVLAMEVMNVILERNFKAEMKHHQRVHELYAF